ncbi:MAG: serine/threonine protein kinase [Phycisphaerales bacterium]
MNDQIGPYRVQREIGRGGMGVVHLATDTRLGRDVAIKALPQELAQDPGRLERFEREAKALASLSHPNLAGIFGVEEQDGARYLILEYVDGETLAERLDRGPIPIDDAIELGIQIASGIEAAHEAGIIHRDLKPDNIKITPEGMAKVLDFGLAKSDENASASGVSDQTPTATIPQHSPTIAGAILGTAAYMSPEQARGRRVDKRSDIWSFGVVLFEMLVGASPFLGETAGDSMGAVLHKEINLDQLRASTPPEVYRLVRRCLVRDKLARLQSIGDARVELQEAARRLESGEHEAVAGTTSRRGLWPAIAITTTIISVALAATLLTRTSSTSIAPDPSSGIPRVLGVSQLTDFEGVEEHPSLSPDGKALLYVFTDGPNLDIYSLRVGGTNPINLTADSEHEDFDPAFGPDGERIAFVSSREGGGIFLMGATGENPRRLTDSGFDPTWTPDGRSLVYTTDNASNPFGRPRKGTLVRVEIATGEQSPIDSRDPAWDEAKAKASTDAVGPSCSPDGSRIAFWGSIEGQRDIFTVAADGGDRVAITDDVHTDWNPVWSADSRTLYFMSDRGGQRGIWSVAIDENNRPAGQPAPLMPGPVAVEQFAISANGTELAFATSHTRGTIYRIGFDAESAKFDGPQQIVYTSSKKILEVEASHDGAWLAYLSDSPEDDIFVLRSDGTAHRRLTEGLFKDRGPVFSPDGEVITFFSNRSGEYKIWQMNRDGTGARILIDSDISMGVPQWTPDGKTLAVMGISANSATHFYQRNEDGTLTQQGEADPRILLPTQWSTDGKLLLCLSLNPAGLATASVYNHETRDISYIGTPTLEFATLSEHTTKQGWIDERRVIGWDWVEERLCITDVVTNESHWIESGFEGMDYVANFVNGETLFTIHNETDGDLWLIDLKPPASAD